MKIIKKKTTEGSIKENFSNWIRAPTCLEQRGGQEEVGGSYTEEWAVTDARSGPSVFSVHCAQGVSCMSKYFVIVD